MKPLIGITSYRHTFTSKLPGPALLGAVLSDDYPQGVEAAGGIPLMIPYLDSADTVKEIAGRIDGLLLSGGDDVNPALYGEEPRIGLGEVSNERDAMEIALIAEMVSLGKPILGICRGIQILNVAFGGTLYQDLPREWKGSIQHSQKARRNHLSHMINVELGSRLYHLLGDQSKLRCNSYHHQAIHEVGKELIPVAWDEEGLVEAVEHPNYGFLLAVQWHPENLWRTTPAYIGLFKGLVEASAGER